MTSSPANSPKPGQPPRRDLSSSMIGRIIGGDFEILREIGRGGMGTVYEAHQESLDRIVALKILANTAGLTGNSVIRFRREAQAAAKLHHINIVPIHAQGEDDGVYYYAMERIRGRSLNEIINDRRGGAYSSGLDLTETKVVLGREDSRSGGSVGDTEQTAIVSPAGQTDLRSSSGIGQLSKSALEYYDHIADQIASLAEALEYAHRAGIIHRDIKPHNFIYGDDGRMYITDFGLARVLEQPGLTTTGEFVGSPLYMSPEQITGGRVAIDHRTDIYSLGATMYEWLTLRPPYPGETREQVITRIISAEPVAPRTIDPKMPVDLETVCLKAIEKSPDQRYGSSAEMAADLRRYLNRDRIRARREAWHSRGRKLVRRNAVAVVLLIALIAVGASITVTSGIFRESIERDRADKAARIATIEEERNQLEEQLHDLEEKQKRILELADSGRVLPLEVGREIISWFGGAGGLPNPLQRPPSGTGESVHPEVGLGQAESEGEWQFGQQDLELIGQLVVGLIQPLREETSRIAMPDAEGATREAERLFREALAAPSLDAAVKLTEDALRNDLVHRRAVYLRAMLTARMLNFDDVVIQGEGLVMMEDTSSPRGHLARGVGRLGTQQFQGAIADFSEALDRGDSHPIGWMLRGLARLYAGDDVAAFSDLDRAVQLAPNDADVFAVRGAALLRRGRFVQAITDFDRARGLSDGHRIVALEQDALWDHVQRELSRVTERMEQVPDDSPALERRGDLYVILGDYELALADYQSAGRIEPRPSLFVKASFASREMFAQKSATASAGRVQPDRTGRVAPTVPEWLREVMR